MNSSQPCVIKPYPRFPVFVSNNSVYVPVKVNGVETIGVLDTGGSRSLLTPEFAAAAKVDILETKERMRGVTGSFVTPLVKLHSMGFGSVTITGNLVTRVYKFPRGHGIQVGALIGLDWLNNFDWDMDFPHQTMRPYDIENCLTLEPPWRNSSTGLMLTSDAFANGRTPRGLAAFIGGPWQVTIPVAFEDGVIDAVLDTGAMDSLLSHDAAHEAGATDAQLDADPMHPILGLNGKSTNYVIHNFADIAIGEQELHDVKMAVASHFDRRDEPMILGMDYISKQHLWLSFGTAALYIDSGTPRKPIQPLQTAHQVAGLSQPIYPPAAQPASGNVGAQCMVEEDGRLTGCRISATSSNALLDGAAIAWLTGEDPPIMQPAYRDGKAVAQLHTWNFNFVPSGTGGTIYALPRKAD